MNRFVNTDPSKCIGCRTCEIACAMAHPIAGGTTQTLTPENFKPRLKLVKNLEVSTMATCHHCVNAPCVGACPTNALVNSDGMVQLIEESCIGCESCVFACPFGAIEMVKVNEAITIAQKCDLCVNRSEGPACIAVCPTDALDLAESPKV